MISIWLVTGLIVTHFIADFLLQTDWMALNKSWNWKALLWHTSVYSLCFFYLGFSFVVVTFLLHTLTDAITSRLTSKLWFVRIVEPRASGYSYDHWDMTKRHWFFVVIGLDQMIHGVTLLWTLKLLS